MGFGPTKKHKFVTPEARAEFYRLRDTLDYKLAAIASRTGYAISTISNVFTSDKRNTNKED